MGINGLRTFQFVSLRSASNNKRARACAPKEAARPKLPAPPPRGGLTPVAPPTPKEPATPKQPATPKAPEPGTPKPEPRFGWGTRGLEPTFRWTSNLSSNLESRP